MIYTTKMANYLLRRRLSDSFNEAKETLEEAAKSAVAMCTHNCKQGRECTCVKKELKND